MWQKTNQHVTSGLADRWICYTKDALHISLGIPSVSENRSNYQNVTFGNRSALLSLHINSASS